MWLDYEKQADRRAWLALTAIALGAFAMVSSEFLRYVKLKEQREYHEV